MTIYEGRYVAAPRRPCPNCGQPLDDFDLNYEVKRVEVDPADVFGTIVAEVILFCSQQCWEQRADSEGLNRG